MRSDDVKRMLESAAATPSRPLDAGALLRRGTRLRRARYSVVAAGLAVTIAGASATFGALGTDRDRGSLPGPAGHTTAECGPPTTATVYLKESATAAETRRLEAELESNPDVVSVDFISRDEVRGEYLTERRDPAQGVEVPPARAWPNSFRVEVVDQAALDEIGYLTGPVVDHVLTDPFGRPLRCLQDSVCPGPSPLEVTVFLRRNATRAEVETVRDLLAGSPDVKDFHYFSKQAARTELEDVYEDRPDLLQSLPEHDLPASFRIVAASEEGVGRLEGLMINTRGVEGVKYGVDGRESLCGPDVPVDLDAPGPRFPVFTDASGAIEVELRGLSCEISPLREGRVTIRATGWWCSVEIEVTNRRESAIRVDPTEQVLTGFGRENVYSTWERAMRALPSGQSLIGSPVGPGGSRDGVLVYQLPRDDSPETVQLSFGPGAAQVVLPLDAGDCDPRAAAKRDAFFCGYDRNG